MLPWVLGGTLAAAVLLQTGTWVVAMRRRRLNVVDVTWGVSFALIAVVGFIISPAAALRPVLVVVLTAVWGLRLGTHILLRQRRDPGEDPRYTELMSRRSGDPRLVALRSVFLLQAVAAWFISLPLQVGLVSSRGPGVLLWVGVIVWTVGFVFESVGDFQLARFRATPGHQGQVMDQGLWRYTRHPNYFGDCAVWWGLFLVCADGGWAWLTILSPALMTWFLVAKTGKPLMEAQLSRSRPGYADYVRRTSGFIPLPPRS